MERKIKLTGGALSLKRENKPAVLMRPKDGAFFAPEELAARLVRKGKAVYVDEVAAAEKRKEENQTTEKKPAKSKPSTETAVSTVDTEPDHIADVGNMPGTDGDVELEEVSWGDMTREELNDLARQFDVEAPEKLPNKASVISAINDAAHAQQV